MFSGAGLVYGTRQTEVCLYRNARDLCHVDKGEIVCGQTKGQQSSGQSSSQWVRDKGSSLRYKCNTILLSFIEAAIG